MFIHFSIILIVFKKKNKKFEQIIYDTLFDNIENDMRELGYGDVAVNKKMKDLNKIFYDILLKIENNSAGNFSLNQKLIFRYFKDFDTSDREKYNKFAEYFVSFYNFCFELSVDSMVEEIVNYEFDYGST